MESSFLFIDMSEIKTHRIFPVDEEPDGETVRGVELRVETWRGGGHRAEYHYTPVVLDADKLAEVKESDWQAVNDDEPCLYHAHSVLAHNLSDGDLPLLVRARGENAGFDVEGHDIDHLIQLQDALGDAEGSKVSPREAECLFYKKDGYSRDETAAILGIGFTTVKTHLSNCKQTIEAVPEEKKALKQTEEFANNVGF